MNLVLGLLIGIPIFLFGLFIFINSTKTAKLLDIWYEYRKVNYDKKYSQSPPLKKGLMFLLFKPWTYYHDETQTRYALLFLSPFLMIWGIAIILIGFGVIK